MPTATHTPRIETLVAVDWDDAGIPVERISARLGDALVDVETSTQGHWQSGRPQTVHRVRFDARRFRNTEAHGVGFHAGFVVHVES